MIPVFVISLPRSADRRSRIGAHLAGLGVPFSFIDALEGDGSARFSRRYQRDLTQGEIGCYRSHKLAAERAMSAGPFACVLEDDAALSPDALPFLRQENLGVLPTFDMLRLEAIWHGRKEVAGSIGGIDVCSPLYPCGGTRAQIYSETGARKVATCRHPISEPIDVHLYYDPPIRRFRLLDVAKPCASGTGTATLIGDRANNAVPSRYRKIRYQIRRRLNYALAWGSPAPSRSS